MKWINFLHLYQPVNTDPYNIEEANEKSYKRIFRALEENGEIKFSLNIAGCLIKRWEEMGENSLIDRFVSLQRENKIELTGTAMYHPILPLIPVDEARRQIEENEEILKKHLGENYKPKGFFLPEMAYNPEVGSLVKEMGYQWIILDEINHNGKLDCFDKNKIYLDRKSGLKIIFRSRNHSNTYVPKTIDDLLESNREEPVITGTDAELYGLRHIDPTGEFEDLLKKENLQTELISDYIEKEKNPTEINLVSGNWNSSEEELKNGQPFYVWYNKKNKIQMMLWDLQALVYKSVYENKEDENFYWARWHLVRGLISCNYWWVSEKDFGLYSGVTWNPDEIERGVNDLTRAIRSLANPETRSLKVEIEKMSTNIRFKIWEKHWKTHWK